MVLFFALLSFIRNQQTLREVKYITEIFSLVNYNMLLGCLMTCSLLSLAGIPPFPGFSAKAFLLQSLFVKGHYFLFFMVIMLSVISVAYYIRIIRMLFFSDKKSYSGPLIFTASYSSFLFVLFLGVVQFYLVYNQLIIYDYIYYFILKYEFCFHDMEW